jgi:NADH pyrophosphatase NudC (nudix superfamily)
MKQVKLRKVNSIKYCPTCGEKVKIIMVDLDGYCPNEISHSGRYFNKLYTIDVRGQDGKR